MLVHVDCINDTMYFEPFLRDILVDIKKNLRDDNDAVILITGRPGVGKSVLALQVAAIVDPEFSLDKVVFRHDQLIATALRLPKYSAIVWDEAREGVASEKALTSINKKVKDFMAEVRQLNLCHIFVMPNFWEFDKQMACYRSDILINVFKRENTGYDRESNRSMPFDRGHFEMYDFNQKKRLYIMGKKNFENFVFRGMQGKFVGRYVVDPEAYKLAKKNAIRALRKDEEKEKGKRKPATFTRTAFYHELVLRARRANPTITIPQIAEFVREQPMVISNAFTHFSGGGVEPDDENV